MREDTGAMGRPRTEVGTHGKITVTGYADAERTKRIPEGSRAKAATWVARTRFRDRDGRARLVEAGGATKGKAETALKAKLLDRQQTVSNGSLRSDLSVGAAADVWLATLEGAELAEGSRNLYAGNVARYVKGSEIEHLTLREANNVGTLERWLKTVADEHGNGAAKGARSVLSGTFALAVRYGVLPHNALKDTRTPKATVAKEATRDPDRAFTQAEVDHLLTVAETNLTATKHDLADVLHFLAGTGVRINEALCLRWEDLNLGTGEVHIRGTKTEFSDRHLHLSARLCQRLSDRLDRLKAQDAETGLRVAGTGVVFHSPGTLDREKPRNRDNAIKQIRRVLDAAGLTWATSHTFRHTVITKIVEAGHDVGLAADQAGHSDLRTTSAYIGRKRSTKALADVL